MSDPPATRGAATAREAVDAVADGYRQIPWWLRWTVVAPAIVIGTGVIVAGLLQASIALVLWIPVVLVLAIVVLSVVIAVLRRR